MAVSGPHTQLRGSTASKHALEHLGHHMYRGRNYSYGRGPLTTSSDDAIQSMLQGHHHHPVFTVVREPLARFVSGFRPHDATLPLCSNGTAPCNSTLRQLIAHARHLAQGPRQWLATSEWAEWAHWLSQTYVLSATTRREGQPVRFSHVLRLETLQEGLADLAPALGVPAWCAGSLLGSEVHLKMVHARRRADANRTVYANALQQRAPETVCLVCRLYASDYSCFGYALPPACRPPACSVDDPMHWS